MFAYVMMHDKQSLLLVIVAISVALRSSAMASIRMVALGTKISIAPVHDSGLPLDMQQL